LFEVGTVARTQAVERTFLIRNDGGRPLLITHIQACCGLAVALAETNVPPSRETVLRATLKPGQGPGFVRKTIYLHTNDPESKIVALRLMGTVLPDSGSAPQKAAADNPP